MFPQLQFLKGVFMGRSGDKVLKVIQRLLKVTSKVSCT